MLLCDQGLNDSLFPKILCDGKVGSGLALVAMCLPYKLAVRRSSTKFAGNWIGYTRYIAICHIGKFVRWHLICCGEGPLFDKGVNLIDPSVIVALLVLMVMTSTSDCKPL